MNNIRGVDLKIHGELYEVFEGSISGTGKKVMLAILKRMTRDMNHIIIGGDTLDDICESLGLSTAQVRNKITELKRYALIEPTMTLRAEYLVNPTFAIKGNEDAVWRFYGEIEVAKGNVGATIPAKGGVELHGAKLPLTEDDYKAIGKYVKGGK